MNKNLLWLALPLAIATVLAATVATNGDDTMSSDELLAFMADTSDIDSVEELCGDWARSVEMHDSEDTTAESLRNNTAHLDGSNAGDGEEYPDGWTEAYVSFGLERCDDPNDFEIVHYGDVEDENRDGYKADCDERGGDFEIDTSSIGAEYFCEVPR